MLTKFIKGCVSNNWQLNIMTISVAIAIVYAMINIARQAIKDKRVYALILIFFIITSANAEETILKDGTVFRRTFTCEKTRGLEAGDGTKKLINGSWIYIQKLKAKDYIPPGEILPLQATEDNGDGNTDWVYIRVDTKERIAKDIKPKETAYAGPD